jgi:cell division protein FtsB
VSAFATGEFQNPSTGGIWQSLNRVVFTLICLGISVPIAYSFLPEVAHRRQQMQRIEALKQDIERQKMLLTRYDRDEMLLKRDPEYISVIARDKLELMKDGETIYRLDDPQQFDSSKMRKHP